MSIFKRVVFWSCAVPLLLFCIVGCQEALRKAETEDAVPPAAENAAQIAQQLLDEVLIDSSLDKVHEHSANLLALDRDLALSVVEKFADRHFAGEFPYLCFALHSLAPALVDPLREGLRSESAEKRKYAAISLGCARGRAGVAIADLIGCLDDSDEQVSSASVKALGWLRSEARPAIPVLTSLVRTTRGSRRESAAQALVLISRSAAEALAEELRPTDAEFADRLDAMSFRTLMLDLS